MAASAAAKAFDGAVCEETEDRGGVQREGRKGRANSGNPIASSPREGKEKDRRRLQA